MPTCAETLVRLLEAYGVQCVFGIPGVHTVELYRGLGDTPIRHVTARHEQGAGFMADGYARVSGRPGVCFLITGPGLTNAATAMGQAYSDSVPMLVISAVNSTETLGMGTGRLHELPNQRGITAGYTVFSHTLLDAGDLPQVLARAFAVFDGERPGPVHIEIPIDKITAPLEADAAHVLRSHRPGPDTGAVADAARLLAGARRPAMILGGGAKDAGACALAVAERLGAPVLLTLAAKGVVREDHPLCLGANLPFEPARRVLEEADVVLAVGTEFSETDRNLVPDPLRLQGALVRIDIEAEQLSRSHMPSIAITSDARLALSALDTALAAIPAGDADTIRAGARQRVAEALAAVPGAWWPGLERYQPLLEVLRRVLPDDGIVVTDSTQLAYAVNHCFPMYRPRSYLTCTTGFGTLGFALPAAAGAKLAAPDRPVLAIVGDGGLQFTLTELATLVENRLAVTVLVWNNAGYGEIRDFMQARDIPLLGVDLYTPDLVAIARGYGCRAEHARSVGHVAELLGVALASDEPWLVELDASVLDEGAA